MSIDEATRHRLHNHLSEFLGPDDTEALMACLPPLGWGDLVTRQYLDHKLEQIDARFEQLYHRFTGELHKAITRQTTVMLGFLATLFVSLAGVMLMVGR